MDRYQSLRLVFGLGLVVLFASACGVAAPAPAPTPIPPTATTAPTMTPVPPTAAPTASPVPVGVVYFFFSTMCEYCAAQAPIMEQFHQDNPNIKVVGVPLYASQADAEDFVSRHELTFEVREDRDLVNALGAVSIHPVTAFQSASGGPLVRASNGKILEQTLTESFQSFITGGSVTPTRGGG